MGSNGRLQKAWRSFRHSLLFVPSILTFLAVIAFGVTSILDIRLAPTFANFAIEAGVWGFLVFAGSSDSAARVLSAVTSTWATIAGVVYSVTLVTIQLSATKYSAQVIPVFEEDRLNQVTLGVFTATFAYALLVLKTVRGGETPFVPIIGVNVAILLALASLGLLIAFIGNLTAYIRPTRFVEDYSRKGHAELPRLIEPNGIEGYRPKDEKVRKEEGGETVDARSAGYVTKIDWFALRNFARERPDLERIDVLVSLGTHVGHNTPLGRVYGCSLDDEARAAFDDCFELGKTPHSDDPDRVAETLADIGVTALSGGATDVGVAKTAVRELLQLTEKGLGQEDPGPAFEADAGDGRTFTLFRERERFHLTTYREIRRIVTKTEREGYWDIAQYFTLHVGPTLQAAAKVDRKETWEDTVSWLRGVFASMFSIGDARARAQLVENMRKRIDEMRERDLRDAAMDVEYALLDAAREAEVAQSVRDALRGQPAGSS